MKRLILGILIAGSLLVGSGQAAFAAQTVELVRFMGTVGSFDEVTPELPTDRRWTSVQGIGDLADSAALSTKTQYTFSLCCCKMVATHGCQSPSLFVPAKLIYRE